MKKENTTPTSETVFQRLELLFNVAVKQKNLNVALKTTELLGKQLGLFVKKPVVGFQKRVPFSFKNVSDEELGIMIRDLNQEIAEKEAKNQQQKRYQ
jgi:hypothetical protein